MIDLSNAKFGDVYRTLGNRRAIIHYVEKEKGYAVGIIEGVPEHMLFHLNGLWEYSHGGRDFDIIDVWSDEPQPKFITVMTSRGDMNVFFEGDDVIAKDVKGCEICRGRSFIHLVQQMKKNLSIIVIDSAQVVDTKMKEIGIASLLF